MFTRPLIAAAGFTLAVTAAGHAQDQIRVVGSSTVYPFSTAVAEQFGAASEFATPVVERNGTGGGFALFCAGLGADTPDVSNASRAIKDSELGLCADSGVTEIVEIPVGFDGIVIMNAKDAPDFELSLQQVFLALAQSIPADETCEMVENPYTLWSDIDADLPAVAIEVFGPPPTSGTRDAFVEIAMEGGAETFACLAEMADTDKSAFITIAHTLREDGAWIDAGENDNAIVNTLENTPTALGVAGFSFLDQNRDRVKGAPIDGVYPTFNNIAAGDYRVSRSLYFYVKAQHMELRPGLHDFVLEFTSEAAWGPFGYLAERGLIPLSDERRAEIATRALDLDIMTVSTPVEDGAGPALAADG